MATNQTCFENQPGYAVFCVLVHIRTVEIAEDGFDKGILTGHRLRQHVQLDQRDHRPDWLDVGGLGDGGVLQQGEGALDRAFLGTCGTVAVVVVELVLHRGVQGFRLWEGHGILLPHRGLCKVRKCAEI